MRRARFAALASILVVGSPGCGEPASAVKTAGASSANGAIGAGAAASDFTARDIEGQTVKLSTYLGKQAILIDFCATWCEPCVAEFPHLRRLYEGNKNKGFVILAVAMDGPETVAQVPAFAKRNQLNFPVLTDEDSRIASLYNPKKSAPLSVLIDKNGHIVSMHEGYNPGDEADLAEEVRKMLDSSASSK